MPEPDLSELEEKLTYLKRNIYKSFPHSRWGSNRDAFSFRRVNTHLQAFKVSYAILIIIIIIVIVMALSRWLFHKVTLHPPGGPTALRPCPRAVWQKKIT